MMPLKPSATAFPAFRILTAGCALSCAFLMAYGIGTAGTSLLGARLIRDKAPVIPWKSIHGIDITRGLNVPPNTHIVFQMPDGIADIQRETLFGKKGATVRYWGYCLPQNDDEATVSKRQGLPGLLFLSEAERAARAAAEQKKLANQGFSVNDLPTPKQIQDASLHAAAGTEKGNIRNQIEVFSANQLCYLMTEQSLSMGLDTDGDTLNDQLEREIGTNPNNPDTDGDGIRDDVEYLTGTSPILRDTDGDGLIDGIEDKNFNGRVDPGETDPRKKDSDRDGLCDGLCRVKIKGQEYYIGEDQNLNGKIDKGETSPLLADTDGNGISDYQEYMNCLLAGKTQCP